MAEEFPYLDVDKRFRFPSPDYAGPEGIVGAGGNLSPGMLLSAYEQGIFPWFSGNEPILWWSPDPRFVLFPDSLHVPRRLDRTVRKAPFRMGLDRAFEQVVDACSRAPRPDQDGTWITDDMKQAYVELHRLGYAHSLEVYRGDSEELAGGLYGVSLGSIFFGESMFSAVPDASKVGFVRFVRALRSAGFRLIDCQVHTEHLARFGAEHIARERFLDELKEGLQSRTARGTWSGLLDLGAGGEPAAR